MAQRITSTHLFAAIVATMWVQYSTPARARAADQCIPAVNVTGSLADEGKTAYKSLYDGDTSTYLHVRYNWDIAFDRIHELQMRYERPDTLHVGWDWTQWDWTQNALVDVRYQDDNRQPPGQPVELPWNDLYGECYQENPDIDPSNGWVLLTGNFGTSSIGTRPDYPYFVLYQDVDDTLDKMKTKGDANPMTWWGPLLSGAASLATLNTVPLLGAAAGFITNLIDGGGSGNIPLSYRVELTGEFRLDGTIQTSPALSLLRFYVPGTIYGNTPELEPLYNQPLGVYSLAYEPSIEYWTAPNGRVAQQMGGTYGVGVFFREYVPTRENQGVCCGY